MFSDAFLSHFLVKTMLIFGILVCGELLGEPNIDGDNGPSLRGTYLCNYISIYMAWGVFVASIFPEKSRIRNYYTVVAYYWLLLFLPACINSLHCTL